MEGRAGLKTLVYYVTGHGYGHATRAAAALAALRTRASGLRLLVRSSAPGWLFPDAELSVQEVDPGMAQKSAIEIDLTASLAWHEALGREWAGRVAEEAAFLAGERAALVVGDIPPLAFAAAARAGVPSAAVTNFSWDRIVDAWAEGEPRWASVRDRYAEAYGRAALLLRLPLAIPLPAFSRAEDVPLLVRRSALSPEASRAALGLPASERRPLVLLSFSTWEYGLKDLSRGDDLSDFLFAGFGPKPAGLRADWVELAAGRGRAYVDALPGCAAVISKPGYGVVSEVLAHRRRLLYLPRSDFRETPALVDALERHGSGRALDPADWARGRWRQALEELLAGPEPAPFPDCRGAEAVADRLAELIE